MARRRRSSRSGGGLGGAKSLGKTLLVGLGAAALLGPLLGAGAGLLVGGPLAAGAAYFSPQIKNAVSGVVGGAQSSTGGIYLNG